MFHSKHAAHRGPFEAHGPAEKRKRQDQMAAGSRTRSKLDDETDECPSLETRSSEEVLNWARDKLSELESSTARGEVGTQPLSHDVQVTRKRVLGRIHEITGLENGTRKDQKVALFECLGRLSICSPDKRRLFNYVEAVTNGVDAETAGRICNMESFRNITCAEIRSFHINEGCEDLIVVILSRLICDDHKANCAAEWRVYNIGSMDKLFAKKLTSSLERKGVVDTLQGTEAKLSVYCDDVCPRVDGMVRTDGVTVPDNLKGTMDFVC